jgi:hypothetical protein
MSMPNDESSTQGLQITLKYSLTRMEIVRYFLRSLPQSPRLLLIVMGSSLIVGFSSLAVQGATLQRFTGGEILNACGLAAGVFCFFVFLVFIQAKTKERTLSVSEEGISTWIGTLRAAIPWAKIAAVKGVGQHVLIVRTTGNSFLIPLRAFGDEDQYDQFLKTTQHWLRASR